MNIRHPSQARRGLAALAAGALAVGAGAGTVRAYDPATTHAGLTERAALASTLNRVLVRRLGKPLGLFEPITFDARGLPAAEAHALTERLGALDPGQGYRPGDDGVATALAWVVAGAVIAGTPAERGQSTFFDPSLKRGLTQDGTALEASLSMRLLLDNGSPRAFATNTDFNLRGEPSTVWLASPSNDVGLAVFFAEFDRAVSDPTPSARSTALARTLLALGGTLAVLQDAGEPAHVRNDFQGAYLSGGGRGLFDRGSAFERHVAETYGRTGVPAPGPPVQRPTAEAFVTASDAQGLADRTQRRFFSAGSLPADAIVDRDTSTVDVVRQARASAPYGLPRVGRLELREMGRRHYVMAAEPNARRRVLAYERVPGRVRFLLDKAVLDDSAQALLPEVGAYSVGLIDHLLRANLTLAVADGRISVKLEGTRGALQGATLSLYAEAADGQRTKLGSQVITASGDTVFQQNPPPGTRRVAVLLRGVDDAGPLVGAAEQLLR